jgi:hypothetical protein
VRHIGTFCSESEQQICGLHYHEDTSLFREQAVQACLEVRYKPPNMTVCGWHKRRITSMHDFDENRVLEMRAGATMFSR